MKKAIIISFAFLFFTLNSNAQSAPGPFSEEAEAGIVAANGNSKAQSYLLKNMTSYKFDAYLAKFIGNYFRNKSRDYTTNTNTDDEKWDLGLRLERDLNEKLGIFVAQSVEANKNAGIDRRYNSDLGAKYFIVKHEGYYTLAELGYRYSAEEYTAGNDDNFNLLRAYIESEKHWSPACSTKLWVEYLPNLDKSKDYNINSELSVTGSLNTTFAIKTAYLVKYDNMPASQYKTDTLLSTSLIAKF